MEDEIDKVCGRHGRDDERVKNFGWKTLETPTMVAEQSKA
jgi:hypothetical protein